MMEEGGTWPEPSRDEDDRETIKSPTRIHAVARQLEFGHLQTRMRAQESAGKADLTLSNAGFILGTSTYGKVTQRAELPALRDCVSGSSVLPRCSYPSLPFANVERKRNYVARDFFLLQQNNGYGGGYGR